MPVTTSSGGRGPKQTPSWSQRALPLPSPDLRLLASRARTQASSAETPPSGVCPAAPETLGQLPHESGVLQCNL